MAAQLDLTNLTSFSLDMFPELFSCLQTPEVGELQGDYLATLTGPRWLRAMAPVALSLGGLSGWRGKRFLSAAQGVNLVWRRGQERTVFPFALEIRASLLDGLPCAVVQYNPGLPLPWPWMVDELRWLGRGWLLGMTLLTSGPLSRGRLGSLLHVPFPFLLHAAGSTAQE